MQAQWSEHFLQRPACTLAWYEAGAGPTVIFLSGGPGDSHHYMRSVAQPLTASFHCVSYDQRGTGKSQLEPLDQETLRISHFFEDIEAMRTHLGLERIRLVGHSWGATLALLYSASHPEQVENVTLVGLGPLNAEMGAVASANADKPLLMRATSRHSANPISSSLQRSEHAALSTLPKPGISSRVSSGASTTAIPSSIRL